MAKPFVKEDFTIRPILVVKAPTLKDAETIIAERLERWLSEDNLKQPPYDYGSLLFYNVPERKTDSTTEIMDTVQQAFPSEFIKERIKRMDGTEDLHVVLGDKEYYITIYPQR